MTDNFMAKQVGLFEGIAKESEDVAELIEKRFSDLLVEVKAMIDRNANANNYFGLEPPERLRVFDDDTEPGDVVLSFGKQTPPDNGSFYIGVEVLNKLQWEVGDKIWIRSIAERPALYDQELLPTAGFHVGKSYQISNVPKVWKYKRIVFPLNFFNFTPWKGRRALHYTATDGTLLIRFPGDFT